MKSNNSKLNQYYNLSMLSKVFYIISAIIIIVPIFIVLLKDIPFSAVFTKIAISTACSFSILGQISKILKNKLEKKSIYQDLSVLIGIFLVFINYIFKF